jgi:predicted MFS family arabinose efflux permease
VVRWSVAAVILLTGVMACDDARIWAVARFFTGIASGFAFVLSASLVLDAAAREHRPHWPSAFFAGVGAGIAASGLLVPAFVALGGWRTGWVGLAVCSALVAAVALPGLRDEQRVERQDAAGTPSIAVNRGLDVSLFLAYGIEGLAYIIPATFLVALVAQTQSLAAYASWTWVVVGLVGMPSVALWNELGNAWGKARALPVALVLQGLGIAAPAIAPGPLAVGVAAVALGATFVGVTSLGTSLARELHPRSSNTVVGRLTAVYGVGQIVGPLIATALVLRVGTYEPALLLAACALLLAGLAMLAYVHLWAPGAGCRRSAAERVRIGDGSSPVTAASATAAAWHEAATAGRQPRDPA